MKIPLAKRGELDFICKYMSERRPISSHDRNENMIPWVWTTPLGPWMISRRGLGGDPSALTGHPPITPVNASTMSKGSPRFFKRPSGFHPPGFALVVTVSLMVLLALLAVGLLSLSMISLRTSSASNAVGEARSNARLALMLALGDLQKHTGPDKVITAPGAILGASPTRGRLTGVWNSWDPFNSAAGAPDYDDAKQSSFRAWLVSDP